MINVKKKGNAFEREVANDIKNAGLDKFTRRSIMSGAVFEPGDIKTKLPFYIECKHQKAFHLYKYWEQIKEDIQDKAFGSRKRPLVVARQDHKDTLAILDWQDFLELLSYAFEGGYEI